MQTIVPTQTFARAACLVFLLACFAVTARAQSTDIAWPSPIQTNEVSGTIVPRDLGDARLTDHFYALTGTPGDLLITVDSRNMNGDLDVFTASGLRPLLKITFYAESTSPVTKSFYLRTREDLILRVEGRTPNDDNGTYRIRLSGSFQPITSGPLVEAENARRELEASANASRGSTGRSVSSTGARIEQPAPPPTEVAAAPTPAPTPVESPAEVPRTTPARPTRGTRRGRRPSTRTTRPTPSATPDAAASESPGVPSGTETKPATPRRRSARNTTAPRVTRPAPEPAAESGPRLLIETSDGTLINRYMSSVRRVTVENGQVVVVGKDGKIQRISLANVVRMTISP